MLINCIIVEDEPLAMEKVKDFLSKVPYLNLLGCFNNGLDIIGFLKEQAVDLIFLDIEMEGLTGIQLLEALAIKPHIIITSAYDKYALKGYELNISDYLLKPFQFDRFIKAVEKVYSELSKNAHRQMDFFFVKTEYRIEKIFIKDVLYIEGMRDYRCIQMEKGRLLTLQTFGELEKMLPDDKLCRIHKSYMVAVSKIESVERSRVRIKDKLMPVSESYKKRFYSLIGVSEGNASYQSGAKRQIQ
jgi:two-component system LytT family response regulator